jgi:1-deoxy-D-xylulose-5-phosphate synthase
LVWDVGHQAYAHKILTGRRERLSTVRQRGGLSGFLSPSESAYDAFGAGHSSTSISAALGIALASKRRGLNDHAIAIIGDGALTAGLAYEALNHAGAVGANLLVILNDNGMSISENVGALGAFLRKQRAAGRLNPTATDSAPSTTGTASLDSLFSQLGFAYTGPIDGHDLPALLGALGQLKHDKGPRLLHILTQKGHGYARAEADPITYHGVSRFDPDCGIAAAAAQDGNVTFSQIFGDWLCEAAERNPNVVAITPAMREGSSLVRFATEYPDRFFDVGIAEQHSVTLAAGLASRGLRPVLAIYSTFLQRAYDQLIHDVCIQRLPVLIAIDRAGLVGPDGSTHNGSFDLTYLRCLPNMTVMAPGDGVELRNMLQTAMNLDGPVAIRYPRATVGTPPAGHDAMPLPIGSAELRRSGRGVALLNFGALLSTSLRLGERLGATVVNMRFIKPLDEEMILRLARTHALLVTIEENVVAGGAGSAVAECLATRSLHCPLLQLGIPDRFLEHGSRDQVLGDAGLDQQGMFETIQARLATVTSRRSTQSLGRRTLRLDGALRSASGRISATLDSAARAKQWSVPIT